MPGYKVTPQELESGAKRLDGTAANIGKELGTAKAEVTRLANDWTGQAQGEFNRLMAEWDRLAQQQRENLANIAKTLQSAGKAYGETEDSVSRAFKV